MVRIACHGQEGLGPSLKEESRHPPWVLERAWAEGMREGQHHMDVGDVEQLRCASREPGRLRPAWTRGAMPIAPGVLGDLQVATPVTRRRMPPEGRSATDSDRPEGAVLLRGQGGAIACQRGRAIRAPHVRHCEGGAVHKGLVQRQRIAWARGGVQGMRCDMAGATGRT
jgi:hypothetical protein